MRRWQIGVAIQGSAKGHIKAAWLRRVANVALSLEVDPPQGEISLVAADAAEVRQLNRKYRGLDEDTDVLAFPSDGAVLEDTAARPFPVPSGSPAPLGEVIFSYPRALEQAKDYGHTLEQEVALLVVHGLLHLLGHDHGEPEQESAMRGKEARALAALGYLSPGGHAKHYA